MRRLSPLLLLLIVFAGIGLILCGYDPPANADPPSGLAKVPTVLATKIQLPAAEPPQSVRDFTYHIRARGIGRTGQTTLGNGSAVSIGNGKFATAEHIAHDLRPGFVVEVKVDDQWVTGRWEKRGPHDLAVLTTSRTDLPGLTWRTPEYGEKVIVRALWSGQIQHGEVSNDETVSLYVNQAGIIQGDSGSGVFGVDGALVGIVRACNPKESRVVYCTPAAALDGPAAAQPVVRIVQGGMSSCPGGVCRVR